MTVAVRLIALDMDGTLLNNALEITPHTRDVLREARARGVTVVLATGRMHCSARPYARALGLGDVPLVSYNGALVRMSESGRVLLHRPLAMTAARAIADYAEGRGFHLQVYVNDQYLVREDCEKARRYAQIAGIPPVVAGAPLAGAICARPTKMLLYEDEGILRQVALDLRALAGRHVNLSFSYSYFLEIVRAGVSKAGALAWLAKRMGIDRSEIMAVGDSENDLEMLEYAGLGVAMGNASAEIRSRAGYVTLSNDEDGVATAVERLVLGL